MKRSATLMSLLAIGILLIGRALWTRYQLQLDEQRMDQWQQSETRRAKALEDQTNREADRIIAEALARDAQVNTAPATTPSTAASAPTTRP